MAQGPIVAAAGFFCSPELVVSGADGDRFVDNELLPTARLRDRLFEAPGRSSSIADADAVLVGACRASSLL